MCIKNLNTYRMERTDYKEEKGYEMFNNNLDAGPLTPYPRWVIFKIQSQMCVPQAGAGQCWYLRHISHFLLVFDEKEICPH